MIVGKIERKDRMAEAEKKSGGGVPKGMPISAVILLVLGLIASQVIPNIVTEEQMARNVILAAIPFILVFASIIIAFMSLVWFVASKLNNNIPEKTYRPIEYILIGGIVLGILFMFQPWIFELFRIGFFLLLISTILYIAWSHVRPRTADLSEELGGVAPGEITNNSGS
jgi:hypothetical protein